MCKLRKGNTALEEYFERTATNAHTAMQKIELYRNALEGKDWAGQDNLILSYLQTQGASGKVQAAIKSHLGDILRRLWATRYAV